MDGCAPGVAETPAGRAIRLLGAKYIGFACDLSTGAVYKWPKRGGGLIPSAYQAKVLELARQRGIDLTAEQVMGLAA